MSSLDQKRSTKRNKVPCTKTGFFVVSCIAFGLLSWLIVLGVNSLRGNFFICDPGYPTIPRNKHKPGVFDSLTLNEYNGITQYLFNQTDLDLINFHEAYPNVSYIYMMDLLVPLKDAVLEHLDFGTKQPDRNAHVVIVRGDVRNSKVEEYHVGPLPRPTFHRKVTNPSYTKSQIPYNSKPVDKVEYKFLYDILLRTSELLYTLMIESYGLSYHNCTKGVDCIIFHDISPRGTNEKERQTWFGAYRDVEGFYLHPLGLEIQIDHSSRDIRYWFLYRIVYNGNFAYSVENLMQKYMKGSIKKVNLHFKEQRETSFSSLWRRGDNEMESPMKGPMLVEPDGHRYKVDGMHISYMKWNMNLRMRTSSGLQLFDIRFSDERIAYELSFQEAAIFFSGYGPAIDLLNTYGNSHMMGASSSELIPGVDCPETSTFLDSDHFVDNDKPFRIENSICIFEDHANIPLRRHFTKEQNGKFQYYGGLGDYKLIIRTISTIWNYDYIFDYIFHLNGVLETKVSISGYLQTTFPLPHELRYGSYIQENIVGNIQQHLFHYKIDLDINGRNNRFATLDIQTESVARQWYNNAQKMQLVYNKMLKRDEYEANYQSTSQNQYKLIYNEFTSSKFGSPRAYRIVNNNEIQFLLEKSNVTKGASWAKFPLAVTQFQDTEEMSTSIYNGNGPWDPVVDFERFLKNNDSVLDQDIVSWVTMGIDKIPHTEDVPTISTPGSQATFYLMPFNFFTECPSISSSSAFHIMANKDTHDLYVNSFGTPLSKSCIQRENKPSTFTGKTVPVD